ncbi:hypothetical protein [Novosphingobium olei]|uniref:hypothetical protein n=1 Tax=Novosphingobium olei TaxID=2728851 RepID=UPI0030904B0E|nr:hypothetical protein NSDW_11740 [Novosphingobium olei]
MQVFDENGLLRLHIGYTSPPRVSDLAMLLQSLSNGFDEFSRDMGYPDRALVVRRISTGSVDVLFDIASKVGAVYELGEMVLSHRQQLAMFCQHLAVTANAALNSQPLPGGTQVWRALARLAQPVRKGEAEEVTAKVQGANGISLEIRGKLSAEQLEAVVKAVAIHRPAGPPEEPAFPRGLTPDEYFEAEEDADYDEMAARDVKARYPLVFKDSKWFVVLGRKPKTRSILIENVDEKQAKALREGRKYTVTGRVTNSRKGERFIADWGSVTRA